MRIVHEEDTDCQLDFSLAAWTRCKAVNPIILMTFFIIAISILIITYSYIGWRLIVPAGLSPTWNTILWAILVLFMSTIPVSILLRVYGFSIFWTGILTWIAYLNLGFFSLVFVFLVVKDLALLATYCVKKYFSLLRGVIISEPRPIEPISLDRRCFIFRSINLGILGIAGILMPYGLYEARRRPVIVKVSVPIHDLPNDLEGFRIVQITDIHISPTIKRDYVQTIVHQVNGLKPDVIVFTGDLADGSVAGLSNDAAPLKDLSALYGSYFVTGNHEYYSGVRAWLKEIKRLGLIVLLNEHRIIQHGTGRILMAGVTDYHAGRFLADHASNPYTALSNAPASNIKILLAHQPRSIFDSSKAGFDLQISGHTHGGQYYPWNFLISLQQPYVVGLHQHGKTWIYVSRGAGYWGPPLRLGAPSEITMITLTRSNV